MTDFIASFEQGTEDPGNQNVRVKYGFCNGTLMETEINISQNQNELAWDMARELVGLVNAASRRKKPVSVALSGGSTPKLLFSILGDNFSTLVRWEYVHFFWSDHGHLAEGPSSLQLGFLSGRVDQ